MEGTFTVVGKTKHVTIRLREEVWCGGRVVVSYLAGPDNTNDFVKFGFVGPENRVTVWSCKKHMNLEHQVWSAEYVLRNRDKIGDFGYEYALRSSRCCKCGRKLTVPASIHRGMGPECATKGW